ncbi:MAG TPA: response regulator [Polyangiaceae bacterium]|jgi:two-component system chemotaxis sensor kinase CheA
MAKDPYKYFRIEARELVDGLRQGALDLEKGPAVEAVARVLRLAHTLKGAARVVKLGAIADHAHAIEDLLEPHRAGAAIASAAVDGVLRRVDEISAALAALSAPAATPVAVPAAPKADAVRVDLEELDRLIADLAEAAARLAPLSLANASLERMARMQSLSEVRAEIDELRRSLPAAIGQVALELAQARAASARLRLMPAERVFSTLERAARDAAQSLGKEVRFVATGGATRLDAHVLEAVGEALLHVVRNAVAHGVHSSGTVRLAVTRSSSRVVFTCTDDGHGLDMVALRSVAVARGASRDAVATDEAVLALLLAGGLSTATAVTDVAGRGVGLDVVREIVAKLRGEVTAKSRSGAGTTFEIRVPVTLTSQEALVVSAGDVTGSIPLVAVRGTLRIPASEIVRGGAGDAVMFGGQAIPFASLSRVLGRETRTEAVAIHTAVVVGSELGVAALGVDRLHGTREVVVQALPPTLDSDATVAGVSLDVEGKPELAFDADALAAAIGAAGPAPAIEAVKARPVLVVDDSLTTRMLERSILESAGYEVDVATSAEEALEKAKRRAYGVFVVDVEMPGMDGFAFVAATRADPALGDVPAILVTSRDAAEDKARGKSVGATAYIVKGEFDQALLLRNVREILG